LTLLQNNYKYQERFCHQTLYNNFN